MSKFIRAIALLVVAPSAMAAPTSYVFDSVSRIDLNRDRPTVTGVLQGATTPTTVEIRDDVSGDFRAPMSRCVPLLLTMMEKPGRYLLHLTVDPATNLGMVSCGLEIRN
jgi:hypothetical protein